ncbi:MAG TPA: hypothetical protein VGN19_11825 [Pedococcus sp.]|jgi:hypothetical protein|nr:hypothetical protein [Pedococcus sp.]
MNDFIALSIIRTISGATDAQSALPNAPVVDDGFTPRPARQVMRHSLAATLRSAAAVEHRWANRLDPAAY